MLEKPNRIQRRPKAKISRYWFFVLQRYNYKRVNLVKLKVK